MGTISWDDAYNSKTSISFTGFQIKTNNSSQCEGRLSADRIDKDGRSHPICLGWVDRVCFDKIKNISVPITTNQKYNIRFYANSIEHQQLRWVRSYDRIIFKFVSISTSHKFTQTLSIKNIPYFVRTTNGVSFSLTPMNQNEPAKPPSFPKLSHFSSIPIIPSNSTLPSMNQVKPPSFPKLSQFSPLPIIPSLPEDILESLSQSIPIVSSESIPAISSSQSVAPPLRYIPAPPPGPPPSSSVPPLESLFVSVSGDDSTNKRKRNSDQDTLSDSKRPVIEYEETVVSSGSILTNMTMMTASSDDKVNLESKISNAFRQKYTEYEELVSKRKTFTSRITRLEEVIVNIRSNIDKANEFLSKNIQNMTIAQNELKNIKQEHLLITSQIKNHPICLLDES